MSEVAIRCEGLGKRYRIGPRERYYALRDTLAGAMYAPFRGLSRLVNPQSAIRNPQSDDTIWALKDVSFEITQGEVVGIIGRNGAGKSTLLKILSRITEPTEGTAEIRGRMGSLLEVGTGFHPELTGRENIYLNGAILGMRKAEIGRKFDEIVAFAEVEKFIDTPVKHYSSGMYVRLAFAVAAHLEPDILLVDEVLAVGDAAFQKKCLGKMGDVVKEGRTVLFVSHNMAAIHRVCSSCILLDQGTMRTSGPTGKVVAAYLEELGRSILRGTLDSSKVVRLRRVTLLRNDSPDFNFSTREPIILEIDYDVDRPMKGVHVGVWFLTPEGFVIMSAYDTDVYPDLSTYREAGRYRTRMHIQPGLLNAGEYMIRVLAFVPHGELYDENNSLTLQLMDPQGESANTGWGHRVGPIVPRFGWDVRSLK